MLNMEKMRTLSASPRSEYSHRIICQVEYLIELSLVNDGKFDELIQQAIDFLFGELSLQGVITRDAAQKAENMLISLSEKAKEYTVICIGHAHIDMNWMWRFDETVAITLATFRTMLDLMKEYPEFTYGQSQGSVYRIVEKYCPEMLEEIKERVKEGRWEITASSWVETDKNMPNGESLSRHILYTKKYLSKLFDLPEDYFNLDFEPDTFGHNINVPEILARGGVKYYYHCRGYNEHTFYKWRSPSGSEILVYKEPRWYNDTIEEAVYKYVPTYANKHNIKKVLSVYGVGDHGGGATRKDIEKIIKMNKWPLMPAFKFGTYKEFFNYIESLNLDLPVVTDELNFIFTGCYTSQSRIKEANRIGENILNEAETYNTFAALNSVAKYDTNAFFEAWENILFNHFHDILPGSGVIDTREYARGIFQQSLAVAGTKKSVSLAGIANNIDNTSLADDDGDISSTNSEGAGVGFGTDSFKFIDASRHAGKNRVFTCFNPSGHERTEVTEFSVWDWHVDLSKIKVYDDKGNLLHHDLIHHSQQGYWGHNFFNLFVELTIPAYGYTTCVLKEEKNVKDPVVISGDIRTEALHEYFLENEYLKVKFDTKSAAIISMVDKKTNKELISSPSAIFRYIEEDTATGMTAWIVGRYKNILNLHEGVNIKGYGHGGLRQLLVYELSFKSSKITITIQLEKGSKALKFKADCDWHEVGVHGKFIPQLNFTLPFGFDCDTYKYDIPFGVIERKDRDSDVPANSFAFASGENCGLMLVTKTKYGFRCLDNSISLDLLRGSYDPDPYPEFGKYSFEFAVIATDSCSNKKLIEQAYDYIHCITPVSARISAGSLPTTGSFLEIISDNIFVSAVKMPENGEKAAIIRLYETEGKTGKAEIKFFKNPKEAFILDTNENILGKAEIAGNTVSFSIGKYSVAALSVVL